MLHHRITHGPFPSAFPIRLRNLIVLPFFSCQGEDRVTEVYRFKAGCSAAEALEIGGGKPVQLGSISKRIKSTEAELAALNERIDILKVILATRAYRLGLGAQKSVALAP